MIKFTTTSKKGAPRWWQDRKVFLERFRSVKNYLFLTGMDNDERVKRMSEYEKYLEDTKKSEAYEIYLKCRKSLKEGNYSDLKHWSLLAKQKLKDADFEKPPLSFDPKNILYFSQEIYDYKEVCQKVEDFEGKSFEKNVIKALM